MKAPMRLRRRPRTRGQARTLASGALALLVAAVGCVASKGDVAILQDELRALRSSIARSDTAQRAQADTAMMLIGRANDSLKLLSGRFAVFQANVSGGMYDMSRQLLQIQELSGQSQRRLQELRASMESRAEAMNVPTPAPGDTTRSTAGGGGGGTPGPAQLFQLAFDQMQRGSF